ncbi:UxaA family hydrolase [Natrialbaceae archaeon AArc-T1-2]|uniref:UxaA family hydrolase n=1 Tax=Natrialbaceae archaeon AArc-T1-2 TaxID=3053904 RepID=UPI00255AC94C|nr:UxaA family hydrolase [Natrialbaceae archaeon AArc-T1-2]WIV67028.1 UxaA family hydrolase [Natrialbaceae archaeon AArc-T1-2]
MTEFLGYERPDGSIGIRNHVPIISTAPYANDTVKRAADIVEGTVPITHPLGRCQTKPDVFQTYRTLLGYATHPNSYGAVVVAHAGESVDGDELAADVAETGRPAESVNIHGEKGVMNGLQATVEAAQEMVQDASAQQREPHDISNLTFGINCATSDTTSGLCQHYATAGAVWRLIEQGGRGVFAETPEFFGGEEGLAERAVNDDVAEKILEYVDNWDKRLQATGYDVRGAQPTPDNMDGGLTTIEEKSLGALVKSGDGPIQDLVDYGEEIPDESGMYIMDTPGHGAESVTGIGAGGAHFMVISTGQGHTLSNAIMPTIKITGNPGSAERVPEETDVDVSEALVGDKPIDWATDQLWEEIMEVANGKYTLSEVLGESQFAIHRIGPST